MEETALETSCKRKKLSVQMIFRYGIVGVLNALAYVITVVVLVEVFKFTPVIGAVIGFFVSLCVSYFLNYAWTFESSQSHNDALPKYLLTSVGGLLLNAGIMYGVVDVFGFWYIYGLVLSTVCVPLFNFTVFYLWAFVPKKTE